METAKSLEEAGQNYNKLFTYYLVVVILKAVGMIPYIGLLTGIGEIVMMVFIFLILRKLVSFSQNPNWLQTSGMARTLALINLLAIPIFIVLAVAGLLTMIPQFEQLQRGPMGNPPDFVFPPALYGVIVIACVLGLAFFIISIVFLYKLFHMSALVGEIINVKKLIDRAKHVKKCFTIILVSILTVPVLAMLSAIIIPGIGGGGQAAAILFVIIFSYFSLDC